MKCSGKDFTIPGPTIYRVPSGIDQTLMVSSRLPETIRLFAREKIRARARSVCALIPEQLYGSGVGVGVFVGVFVGVAVEVGVSVGMYVAVGVDGAGVGVCEAQASTLAAVATPAALRKSRRVNLALPDSISTAKTCGVSSDFVLVLLFMA